DVKNSGNPSRGARPVIFGVNDDDRNDDQVCVNKRNDTAETDAVRPKQTGERNVSDRTDERDHGNDRADQGILDQPNNRRSRLQKQSAPPIMRHQRHQTPDNQKDRREFLSKASTNPSRRHARRSSTSLPPSCS